jgi:hypothetical protein
VEIQHDSSVRIEPASISHVAVVVINRDGVVELCPANALQVDGKCLALLDDERGNTFADNALLDV